MLSTILGLTTPEQLCDFLVEAIVQYDSGQSMITDSEFDELERELRAKDPLNACGYTRFQVNPLVAEKYNYTMGSIAQIPLEEAAGWIEAKKRNGIAVMMVKLDGISCGLTYHKGVLTAAHLRGDGEKGFNVTHHVRNIPNVKHRIDYDPTRDPEVTVVRGEIVVRKSKFDQFNNDIVKHLKREPYKNSRNGLAGMFSRIDAAESGAYANVEFVAYHQYGQGSKLKSDVLFQLQRFGFDVVKYWYVSSNDDSDFNPAMIQRVREQTDYELDGVVLQINNGDNDEMAMYPSTQVKLKSPGIDNLAETTVTHVEWNVSQNNKLVPTIWFEPVTLLQTTVVKCTGHNYANIVDKNIGPGTKILVTRRGDVTPYCEQVLQCTTAQLPDCEYDVVGQFAYARGVTPQVQALGLNAFFVALDVNDIGEQTCLTIIQNNGSMPDIVDLLTMSESDLSFLIESSAVGKKVHSNIQARLNDVTMDVIIGAHPMMDQGIGQLKIKNVLEYWSVGGKWDVGVLIDPDRLAVTPRVGEKTAELIATSCARIGIVEFMARLTELTGKDFQPKTYDGIYSGEVIVFSGFRDAVLKDKLIKRGADVANSLTSATTILVVDDVNGTSGKILKARKQGTKIIAKRDLVVD